MFDFVGNRFGELPTWGKWAVGLAVLVSVDALFMSWGERRFVAAFAEAMVAVALYWGTALVPVLAGIWAGMKVAEKTFRSWLGWVIGLAVLLGGWTTRDVTKKIPGVGWRVEKMELAREELLYD